MGARKVQAVRRDRTNALLPISQDPAVDHPILSVARVIELNLRVVQVKDMF